MSLTKHEKLAPNSGIFGLICLVQEILFVKGEAQGLVQETTLVKGRNSTKEQNSEQFGFIL